jgi:hypothetical protein
MVMSARYCRAAFRISVAKHWMSACNGSFAMCAKLRMNLSSNMRGSSSSAGMRRSDATMAKIYNERPHSKH